MVARSLAIRPIARRPDSRMSVWVRLARKAFWVLLKTVINASTMSDSMASVTSISTMVNAVERRETRDEGGTTDGCPPTLDSVKGRGPHGALRSGLWTLDGFFMARW